MTKTENPAQLQNKIPGGPECSCVVHTPTNPNKLHAPRSGSPVQNKTGANMTFDSIQSQLYHTMLLPGQS